MAEFLNLFVKPLFTWKHSELLFFISWPKWFLGNIFDKFGTCKNLFANFGLDFGTLDFGLGLDNFHFHSQELDYWERQNSD